MCKISSQNLNDSESLKRKSHELTELESRIEQHWLFRKCQLDACMNGIRFLDGSEKLESWIKEQIDKINNVNSVGVVPKQFLDEIQSEINNVEPTLKSIIEGGVNMMQLDTRVNRAQVDFLSYKNELIESSNLLEMSWNQLRCTRWFCENDTNMVRTYQKSPQLALKWLERT